MLATQRMHLQLAEKGAKEANSHQHSADTIDLEYILSISTTTIEQC